jgi:hypothetical protein
MCGWLLGTRHEAEMMGIAWRRDVFGVSLGYFGVSDKSSALGGSRLKHGNVLS